MSLQKWMPAQDSPEIPVNENFEALAHMAVYAKDAATTSGLTWGYVGGSWRGQLIQSGVIQLSPAATNYVVVNRATGAVSVSTATTNWNNGLTYARVYKLTVGAATVTATEDWRVGQGGVHGSAVGAITVSATPPESPQIGDLWLDIS